MKKSILIIVFLMSATAGIFAQCFPDRHNTNWFDGWISCTTSANPNTARGNTHWIMYDLNHKYNLGQMHVWNSNSVEHLQDGIKDVVIDVSDDGVNWTEIGQYEFQQANGSPTYEGFTGPDLTGYHGKYLLITGLTNWGGTCFGLSEIKVDVLGIADNTEDLLASECFQINISPNPVTSQSKAIISTYCSTSTINYSIQDITGKTIISDNVDTNGEKTIIDLNLSGFPAGSYLLTIRQNGIVQQKKITKIK